MSGRALDGQFLSGDASTSPNILHLLGRRLDRPENAGLKPYFAKLAAAKAAIDEKSATIGER